MQYCTGAQSLTGMAGNNGLFTARPSAFPSSLTRHEKVSVGLPFIGSRDSAGHRVLCDSSIPIAVPSLIDSRRLRRPSDVPSALSALLRILFLRKQLKRFQVRMIGTIPDVVVSFRSPLDIRRAFPAGRRKPYDDG